jgi:HEAT repeat protein
LEEGLRDKAWSVRAAAIQMVAHTGRVELINLLPPLFNDKKEKVQFRTAGAYLHLALKNSR